MKKLFLKKLFLLVLVCLGGFGFAQTADLQLGQDPAALIGATLTDLIGRFGVPKQVYAVRGVAAWQDDVVFVYDGGEFYIFGNRVWQLMLRSAYNVKDGDNRAAVSRVMGEGRNFEGYTLFQLPGKAWPVMLRVNWDASGKVAGIYIYRSDF
jgi:hypothetical protein